MTHIFLQKLENNPEQISFDETIAYIDENYDFSPTAFINGELRNEANQNNGSCKIFGFAKLKNLSKDTTLQLFGDFYRLDVLNNPNGSDHLNIRNFIKFGWEGLTFENDSLALK
ncbi:HopJ type III effector protein [Epilithonimonas bovis DSM 19482]|uniref:HopJ type III effector protein n=1 Tax=Epilithonimonas bovis DSM 19482 TaxID=1121284 RepID=A0A1U7PX61_9FLAO|nr:HopJ type III effector protein [Epilithonimonas bovis]SIT96563.1 HopJ type III effector protein [Epilithonimonas bovis DSM 19482]